MTHSPTDAVIRFEPDGYDLNRPWLLGRQSAGHSFLRAAVQGRGEGPVYGYTPHKASAQMFDQMVRGFDASAQPEWIAGEQIDRITQTRGVLYLADPTLTDFARVRLRAGPARYSLCGVTHTLATAITQRAVAELLSEAVMPWDALICTSTAALKSVETTLEAQTDFLRWRFGADVRLRPPQLPVIPLGVHCDDFDFAEDEKPTARRALGVADDEVAALYVGRLVFTGKAHPFPVFQGLQTAAERSGKKLVLILCGRSPNESMEQAYLAGAAQYAPDVRIVSVDSRDDAARRGAWAAGDIFISLADGIQETFGLTPVEAMAAGLPAVVSDYNGYRDTVRDGIDGFRIATWAPGPGRAGETYALRQELNLLSYDRYCWVTSAATSVDIQQLVDHLIALVEQPDLRRRMGQAGRARARETFDWAHVYRQYQALWADLNARRLASAHNPDEMAWMTAAPRSPPARLDPFLTFGHYPTNQVGPETRVALAPGVTLETYRERLGGVLFPDASVSEAVVLPIWAELEKGAAAVAALAPAANLSPAWAIIVIGVLAKMGLVTLGESAM
jgi:glycosyltransferase involved in cell wall biosynthesis